MTDNDIHTITRLHQPSLPEVQRLIFEERKPVLLTGMIESWPALSRWTPEFLKEAHGDDRIKALVDLPASGVTLPGGQEAYQREMSLRDFLELMVTTPPERPCYLAYSRATDLLP